MAVTKSVSKSLRAQVAEAIGMKILDGTFIPGEAMPTEGELSEMAGVSRTTLRGAVQSLAAKGLVSVGPSRGTRVQARGLWNLLDADVIGWRLQLGVTTDLVRQIYELRECFEPRASYFAAERGSDPDHLKIAEAIAALKASRTKGEEDAAAADVEFHMAILSSSGNDFIISFGSMMKAILRVSFIIARRRRSLSQEDIEHHEDIARAIATRDPEAAEEATRRLLMLSKNVQMDAAAKVERSTHVTRALASNRLVRSL